MRSKKSSTNPPSGYEPYGPSESCSLEYIPNKGIVGVLRARRISQISLNLLTSLGFLIVLNGGKDEGDPSRLAPWNEEAVLIPPIGFVD